MADDEQTRSDLDPELLDRFFVDLSARLDTLDDNEVPRALARLVLLLVRRVGTTEGLDQLVDRAAPPR